METAVIIFLVLLSSLLIIWPLLKGAESPGGSPLAGDQEMSELDTEKEKIYQAIKEIEFDLAMGKLSKEDFEKMKSQYMLDAMDYLRKIDHFHLPGGETSDSSGQSFEEQIEKEVSLVKARLKSPKKRRFCNQCGDLVDPGDRFCFNCGVKLTKA
ncbi:MAG: zinc ribbon domain-containing protein [Deltaproteobacteria bacterium]|nr:zinc ribbon domain-containing protein [Deltaproteobacteria bacterium]